MDPNDRHQRRLEAMYHGAPINAFYKPTMIVGDASAEVAIDVVPAFFHAGNAVHGSVYFRLLDDACYFAVASVVTDVFVVTSSFTTYLTRPVMEGRLTARGRVVHSGKSVFLAEAEITLADGKTVGRGNGAFMRSSMPLGPEIGYGAPGA